MAALLSNAFGRKNLLGGSSKPEPARSTPSPGVSDYDDGGVPGLRSRAGTNDRSRPGTSDNGLGVGNRAGTNDRSRPGTSDAGMGMGNRPGTSDGYANGAPAGNPLNQPLWTPMAVSRRAAYHVQDPVSMHLLMENALEDSQAYEVLTPDEVTSARTELDELAGRVEAAQRKLALETKVRDAAKSMNQLEKIEEAQQATLRCEALQEDLAKLQAQEIALQRRVLEHTAGVLQMTHKGDLNGPADPTNVGSFDHQHFYEPSMLLDALDGKTGGGAGGKLSDEQQAMIGTIQHKVEDLNGKIRELLRGFDAPTRDIPPPAKQNDDPEQAVEMTLEGVNSLDQCFLTVQRLQRTQKREREREQRERERDDKEREREREREQNELKRERERQESERQREQSSARGKADEAGRSVGDMNRALYRTISADKDAALAAPPSDKSLSAQLSYLEQVNKTMSDRTDRLGKYDSTLRGLWEMLANPEEDGDFSLMNFSSKIQEMNIKFSALEDHKKVLTRQIQQQREINEKGDGGQKDAEIADLKEQLDRAQTDLTKTEEEMDSQIEKLSSTIDDLETAKAALAADNQAATEAVEKELKAEKAARDKTLKEERSEHEKTLKTEKDARTQEVTVEKRARLAAEDLAKKVQDELAEANSLMEVNSLAIKADLERKIKAAEEAEKKQSESDAARGELEGEVARLATELTIAKAELDGAYGSRAERAAERDPELQARVKELETELQETIADYEQMTKATIEHEKEKDEMEAQLDTLRDQVEGLETELSEERVGGLGGKGGDAKEGGGAGATSAAVLRTEFKKMMKDAREQHSKALKAEKDERRKLEAQIRQLKRDALPVRGKAPDET